MGTDNVVNQQREIESLEEYRTALENRVLEMTESILIDTQKSLEAELEGLALK